MRIACAVLFVVGLSLPRAQAGEIVPFEDVIKQMLETMDSLSKTLATIQDQDSAKTAQPELRKTAERWKLIKKKAETIPPPTKDEKDRLAKEYKQKLEQAQKKLFGEVARVRLVPGGQTALQEISSVFEKKVKE